MGGPKRPRALATALAFVALEAIAHFALRSGLIRWLVPGGSEVWLQVVYAALGFGVIPAGIIVAFTGARAGAVAAGVLMAAGAVTLGHAGGALTHAAALTFVAGVSLARIAAVCLVAEVYDPDDPRRDVGFTLYAAAASLGGFVGPLLFGFLAMGDGSTLAATVVAAIAVLAAVVALGHRRVPLPPPATPGSSPAVVVAMLLVLALLELPVAVAASQLAWLDLGALASTTVFGIPVTVQLLVAVAAWLLLAPILAFAWSSLGARAPSSPAKIAAGVALAGAAPLLLLLTDRAQPSPAVVVPAFLLDGVAQLCFAPIALSLLTARVRGRWQPIVVAVSMAAAIGAGLALPWLETSSIGLAAAACAVASVLGFAILHRLTGGQARARR